MDIAAGGDFSSGSAALGACLSLGFENSSKLDVSSPLSSASLSESRSLYLEARSLIELVCSFIDGIGPRNVGDGSAGALNILASLVAGDGA